MKNYGPKELEAAGIALFGPRWQTNLARELGLSDARRIRQWMATDKTNRRPIPDGIWGDIASLLELRKKNINRVLRDLGA